MEDAERQAGESPRVHKYTSFLNFVTRVGLQGTGDSQTEYKTTTSDLTGSFSPMRVNCHDEQFKNCSTSRTDLIP